MGNDAHASYAQQRSATVFCMIEPLFKVGKRVARKIRAHLPRDRRFQSFLQYRSHQLGHAFGSLERHITDKSIGHDHIDVAVVQVTPFYVANKLNRELLEELKSSSRQIVALGFLFSNREQSHAR